MNKKQKKNQWIIKNVTNEATHWEKGVCHRSFSLHLSHEHNTSTNLYG